MKNDVTWLREQVASWTAKNRNTGLNLTMTELPPPSSDEEHEEDEEEAELSGRIAELHDLKDSVPARFLNMVYEETALRVEVEKEKRQLGRNHVTYEDSLSPWRRRSVVCCVSASVLVANAVLGCCSSESAGGFSSRGKRANGLQVR
jgi:hypothetical protein